MKTKEFYKSLAKEIYALKERFQLISADNIHYLSDGEFKESILRAKLREFLPDTVKVGRGFIISEKNISSQIDILIYKNSSPIIFRDSDLVILPNDEILGIIEVKSKIKNKNELNESLKQLKKQSIFLKSNAGILPDENLFIGLFIYDFELEDKIQERNGHILNVIGDFPEINHIGLGKNIFVKKWKNDQNRDNLGRFYFSAYQKEDEALGYFLFNAISYFTNKILYTEKNEFWFPRDGKTPYKIKDIRINQSRI